jgi:hypothetical protein
MTISLKTVMENLPPEQRAKVEQRAAELIAEEMTLQDLRKARRIFHVLNVVQICWYQLYRAMSRRWVGNCHWL